MTLVLSKIWTGLKFLGRWLGPSLILFALWLVIFPMGPWGDGADMPVLVGAIVSAIAWGLEHKSSRVNTRRVLATAALLGFSYWGWSSWEQRQGYTTQLASFDNQGAHLVGTLYLPARKSVDSTAKVPGIVFLSGSGAIPGKHFGSIGSYFSKRGFAVLIYDKRGVGASTGIREAKGFLDVHRDLEALAGDAAAGLTYLRSRPELRGQPVGFVGISEGGIIAPRAAALNGKAAFMLNITTSTSSLFEISAHQQANMAETKAWFGKDFDPIPSLRTLDIPALWLGASWDPLVDNASTAHDVEVLRELGKPYEYRLIPNAWHGLVIAPETLTQTTIDSWLARVTAQKH